MKLPDYLTEKDMEFLELCFDVFVEHGGRLSCEELRRECYARWERKAL